VASALTPLLQISKLSALNITCHFLSSQVVGAGEGGGVTIFSTGDGVTGDEVGGDEG
jgi:hypothetical protein